MDEFTLTIKLGNAAMQTPDDVARALEDSAKDIRTVPDDLLDGKIIRDENGNTVGRWEFK